MKNLKKVLAMVLAFACTFTMFAGAKVFEDVKAGSDYSEAITMLSDLGVIKGKTDTTYAPEETITREEACALIARLLTGEPDVVGFENAQNFTDTKYSWAKSAIGYCVVNGIAVGDGNGKFRPTDKITDAEFVTMVVRAMGYETPDMKQNWPHAYLSAAMAKNLLDNVNMVATSDALRGENAQIIYNALFADYARGALNNNQISGTTNQVYPTLAESVWNLSKARVGKWDGKNDEKPYLDESNCEAHTWVIIGNDPSEEGHILAYPIDDDNQTDLYNSKDKNAYRAYSFEYAGDVTPLVGYQVELYGEGSHGKSTWKNTDKKFVFSEGWTIKAIKTMKGQSAYNYNASMADKKDDNGTIELEETSLKLDSVADTASTKIDLRDAGAIDLFVANGYNGTKSKLNDKDVEKALNVRDGAQYKLMDWDSDGDIDWIVVDPANYYKVESVNSKRLTVSSMKSNAKNNEEKETASETQTWKLDDLNSAKGYKVKVEAPEGLKADDIVEVTYKISYDKKEKSQIVTATLTVVESTNHELDKVSTKNDLVLTFDGETMTLAQNTARGNVIVPANPAKYLDFDENEVGSEFALWQNRNGFIIYSDYASESSNYMMVLDTDDGDDSVRGKLGAINFMTANGDVKKGVEVAADLTIDRDSKYKGYNKNDHSFDESKIVGNVYKYWTDSDGKITKMESMIDFKDDGKKESDYEYVSKNDRLILNNKSSYALDDAKVIFAVAKDYIKHTGSDKSDKKDLKVESGDVLAVKASDIPDIKTDEDTTPQTLDSAWTSSDKESWIGDSTSKVAISTDNNKDISAAVLGVNNFNKFNSASTKVGLVTNISYDKNDVVSIDVATNGKVETLSSAEKTDFDDIVSVLDYKNNKEYNVGSSNEEITNGIMNGSTLRDYLNKNAAYAEITTNADGNLTGVMFMDEKDKDDAASGKNNENNAVIGNYYQVSRKVVADVKEDKWMSVYNNKATFANEDALMTLDTKDGQTASDFAGDVTYYTIDGKPGAHKGVTAGKAMSILDGFDGNPDITAGEASDVHASDVRNDSDAANDLYEVADVASKIDANGKGDIVAVYMYDDSMEEVIGITGNSSISGVSDIAPGAKLNITVNATSDKTLDTSKMYVDVIDTGNDNKVVLSNISVKTGSNTIDTSTLPVGNYKVVLYGYNNVMKDHVELANQVFKIEAQTFGSVHLIEGISDNAFNIEILDANKRPVSGLSESNFTVTVSGKVLLADQYNVTPLSDGQYQIQVRTSDKLDDVKVTVLGTTVDLGNITTGGPAIKNDNVSINYLVNAEHQNGNATRKLALTNLPDTSKLKIAIGDSGSFDYNEAEETSVTDSITGVTVTLDKDKAELKLSGRPKEMEDFDVTVGDGNVTGTLHVTIEKNKLNGVSLSASGFAIKLETYNEDIAKALADELNKLDSKTNLVKTGSSTANEDKSENIDSITSSDKIVTIRLSEPITAAYKVQVNIPNALEGFTSKTLDCTAE